HPGARLSCHPGRRDDVRLLRDPGEPGDGPGLPDRRPAHPDEVMTEVRLQEPPLDDLVAREALAAEPGALDVARQIVFGRISTGIALGVVIVFVAVAVLAPWIAPYDPLRHSILQINKLPSWEHWLGTDQFGRDVLSRMIH